jgi:hypothetical protein
MTVVVRTIRMTPLQKGSVLGFGDRSCGVNEADVAKCLGKVAE